MHKLDFSLLEQLPSSNNFALLEDVFVDLKKLVSEYYKEPYFHPTYIIYLRKLLHNRLKMLPEYICDVTTKETIANEDDILNYIVSRHHKKILQMFEDRYQSINQIDLADNCIASSYCVKDICTELKIPCQVAQIHPGYEHTARLFGMSGYHYFTIITLNDKKYLIDCTYKQFFKKGHASLEEIGVPLTCAPLAGVFMLQNDFRKKVASKILKDGWIELTADVLKAYCDGFTLSFRNGLYYENFDTQDFTTTYTDEDYFNFLENKDSQINHEPLECLGPLKKVLKKPLIFKK